MSDDVKDLGAFESSLVRNNSQIKKDRAADIRLDAETVYKRQVEDLEIQIRKLVSRRSAALDLSPTNSMSLVPAGDFDGIAFATKDQELTLEIRTLKIRYICAKARFTHLFVDRSLPEDAQLNAEFE